MANQIKHKSKWTPVLGVIIFVITMLWLVLGSTFITLMLQYKRTLMADQMLITDK